MWILVGFLAAVLLLALCLPGPEWDEGETASLLTGRGALWAATNAHRGAQITATPSLVPSPTPSPTPDGALAADHFWLTRPL
jgi:hypothetical protein